MFLLKVLAQCARRAVLQQAAEYALRPGGDRLVSGRSTTRQRRRRAHLAHIDKRVLHAPSTLLLPLRLLEVQESAPGAVGQGQLRVRRHWQQAAHSTRLKTRLPPEGYSQLQD